MNEMKSKLMTERQNRLETSRGGNTTTTESTTDAAHTLMEKEENIKPVAIDHGKSLQCSLDTSFTSEA